MITKKTFDKIFAVVGFCVLYAIGYEFTGHRHAPVMIAFISVLICFLIDIHIRKRKKQSSTAVKEYRLIYFIVSAIWCVFSSIGFIILYLYVNDIIAFLFFFATIGFDIFYFDKVYDIICHLSVQRVLILCEIEGTIIKTKSGNTSPEDFYDWQLRPEVVDAIRNYNPTAIHIIYNQDGSDKGFDERSDLLYIVQKIAYSLSTELDKHVSGQYNWNEDPDEDPECKPKPGMIYNYLKENAVFPRQCLMVGSLSGLPGQSSDIDLQFANNAHVKYQDVDDFVRQYNTGYR